MCNHPPKFKTSRKSHLQDAFDDLSTRFIMNCPVEEFQSFERLFFQLEQAHWFYEDFLREKDASLPGFSLKDFCAQFFELCPLLKAYKGTFDENYAKFHSYKVRVPVCGAILFNSDLTKVVLVRGWNQRSGWGFPKGKINKDEDERECAIREVLEETGFDCRQYLGSETDFLEVRVQTQTIRLYLATNVPEETLFETQTRKEIGKIAWFNLNEIPHNNSFYMVVPFLPLVKDWVKRTKKAMPTNHSSARLGLSPNAKQTKTRRGSRQGPSDEVTFGPTSMSCPAGWGAEEMFRTNEQMFGVKSDYDFEKYTTPLPLHDRSRARSDACSVRQDLFPQTGQISLMHLLQPAPTGPAKENSAVVANQDRQWQAWNTHEMHKMQRQDVGMPASAPGGINFPLNVPSSSLPNSLPTTPELLADPGLVGLMQIPHLQQVPAVPVARERAASAGLPVPFVPAERARAVSAGLPIAETNSAPTTARACSTETEDSSVGSVFHFDKSEILGAMIF
jgi:8-oxo-dGTP pyrophosphatase MutT (NUDIX family)